MKWNKLNKKQPKIKQKVIWRTFKGNSFYPIYYGTYLGIMEAIPNSEYYLYTFEMWENDNLSTYDIERNDIIWIPYPKGEE